MIVATERERSECSAFSPTFGRRVRLPQPGRTHRVLRTFFAEWSPTATRRKKGGSEATEELFA